MNFHWPIFGKQPHAHVVVRHVVSTKAEDAAARRRKADVVAQLAVYRAVTTPEQRRAEADAYFARAAQPEKARVG